MKKKGIILWVDFETISRDVRASFLEKEGYTVFLETDYDQALAVFERERARIVLVIVDPVLVERGDREEWQVEDFIGIQLAKVLLAKRIVPMIFVTNTKKFPPEVYSMGTVLTKPVLLTELLEAVEEALSDKSAGA